MIEDALMSKMNDEYQDLIKNKPVKENRFDIFYDTKLKKWHIAKFDLHNKICDRAITLLNKGKLH